ncbi:MAG: alpha-tubulin suppressor-like RCC1 family protein [Myxococcota bacterium]|jgi:alpha-tubulin suppressor-like RCC1 family protein
MNLRSSVELAGDAIRNPSSLGLGLVCFGLIGFGVSGCTFVVEPDDSTQPSLAFEAPTSSGGTTVQEPVEEATQETPINVAPEALPAITESPEPPPAILFDPLILAETIVPVAEIAVGGAHVCALSYSGDVACWGQNDVGQLGYAHPWNIGDDEAVNDGGIVDVGASVVALSAGDRHTCALMDTNRLRCWGFGGDLALGRGNGHSETIGDDETPADVGDAIIYSNAAFASLAAGDHHTCMLNANGLVKCWGDSAEGALGYGYSTKTGGWLGQVAVGGSPVMSLTAGCEHTCAILDSGSVRCWGHSAALGYGGLENIGDNDTPNEFGDLDLGEPMVQIAAGHRHTCALTTDGSVRCWGMGGYGALGGGDTNSVLDAGEAAVVQIGDTVTQIAAGRRHTCALTAAGSVYCWGDGAFGALGYGNTQRVGDNETPIDAGAVQLGEAAVTIGAGDGFTCAIGESGQVRCWGKGLGGRLGTGSEHNIGDDEVPASVPPLEIFVP